jgi:hypothetical protein
MSSVADKILARVKRHGAGRVFTARHLADLASRPAVDQALSRLVKENSIRRIAWGLYDIPQVHPVLGPLTPNPDSIAAAAAEQAGHKLQVSPARAANLLGVSSQVPAKLVYLTDGSSREIRLGRQVIRFKHAGPRNFLGAGTKAGVALQALRSLGRNNVTPDVVNHLRNSLPNDAKTDLRKLSRSAPQWTVPIIDAITANPEEQ